MEHDRHNRFGKQSILGGAYIPSLKLNRLNEPEVARQSAIVLEYEGTLMNIPKSSRV